jgi:hypothetical protein
MKLAAGGIRTRHSCKKNSAECYNSAILLTVILLSVDRLIVVTPIFTLTVFGKRSYIIVGIFCFV